MTQPPRLVVHLDVNETMILGDRAGGDSFEDSLNKIVCKQVVVRRVASDDDDVGLLARYEWADGRPLVGCQGEPPALHFWDLPEGCVRFYEERQLKHRFAKVFCTSGDSPGSVYSSLHSQLDAALRRGAETDPRLVRGDYLFVLPAVWRLLESLDGRRATVVVRTFGSDLEEIAEALTAFAEARPGLRAFSRPKLFKLRRIDDTCELEPTAGGPVLDERAFVSLLERDDVALQCFGVSDDYASWRAAGFDPSAGKPCWISPTARHVFFDDSIHNNPIESIVSVRWLASSGKVVPLSGSVIQRLQGLVPVRVPTLAAILDTNWFVDKLRRLEADLDAITILDSAWPQAADAWFPRWVADVYNDGGVLHTEDEVLSVLAKM